MATNDELERRLAAVERELAELKRDRRTQIQPHRIAGTDPSYSPAPAMIPVYVPTLGGSTNTWPIDGRRVDL